MVIGGFQPFSLSEYAGKIAAIVFTQGCNFRCPFCHNPQLVDPSRYATPINEDELFELLQRRVGRLEGVCITGGEPTIQSGIKEFIARVSSCGLLVKLETNGSRPDILDALLDSGLVSFVSLDIKAPLAGYERVAGVPVCAADLSRSIALVISSGVPHELRTTYHENILSLDDLRAIAELARGCNAFALQRLRPRSALDPKLRRMNETSERSAIDALSLFESLGIPCTLR